MDTILENFSFDRYGRILLIISTLMSFVIFGFFGYRWYHQRLAQQAHKDLAEHIESYNKALSLNNPNWDTLEQAFSVGAQRYKRSALAPYFLAYQAQVLVEQQKVGQAVELLNKVIVQMSEKAPLYNYYALKRALLKLDTQNETVKKEGESELAKLAQSKDIAVRDMALYYRGIDALTNNNKQLAQDSWNELINKAQPQSYWYTFAQEKLNQL